jgi:PleD family two-component response regulator
LVAYPGTSVQDASAALERVRQTVEQIRFEREGTRIAATVSCAAVEATGEDTSRSVQDRLFASLHEAQRYGSNRTFVHQGQHASPVVPPQLSVSESVVEI